MKNVFFLMLCIIYANSSFAQTILSKNCSKCHKQVSVGSKVGQKCPHCGVVWGSEHTSVSERNSTLGNDILSNSITSETGSKKSYNVIQNKNTSNRSENHKKVIDSFIKLSGFSSRSTTQDIYNIFGKPSDIETYEDYEVWTYNLEKPDLFKSNKSVLFCFNQTRQTLSNYILILDEYVSNINKARLKDTFVTFFKNDPKLNSVFLDKFEFQNQMGLPSETAAGNDIIVCRYISDKVYIDIHWRKSDYTSQSFKVSFEKP